MPQIPVKIKLTDVYLREQFAISGQWPSPEITLTIDTERDLDEPTRRRVLDVFAQKDCLWLTQVPGLYSSSPYEFPAPPATAREALDTYLAAHATAKAKAAATQRERDEKNAIQERERAEHQAQERQERQTALEEQKQWIATHGSARLKLAAAGNYPHQTLYASERAALEHPDFTLDHNDSAQYSDPEETPPEAILQAAQEHGGEVVSLSQPPHDSDDDTDDDDFPERPAVIIPDFLDQYTLIRTADLA